MIISRLVLILALVGLVITEDWLTVAVGGLLIVWAFVWGRL